MSYALLTFVALTAALAVAGILAFLLQFFADGWHLPTREQLELMGATLRKERTKHILTLFTSCFLFVLIVLVLAWHLGATP